MNVQGDYEPMDAGGFIKINALRYVIYFLFFHVINPGNGVRVFILFWIRLIGPNFAVLCPGISKVADEAFECSGIS